MANNKYNDKVSKYEIRNVDLKTVDKACFDYFDKKLGTHVDFDGKKSKVPVLFATGERWKIIRDNNFRDENGTLKLPLISIKRMDIDRTPGEKGFPQEVPYITVSSKIHSKQPSKIQNLVNKRKKAFPVAKKNKVVQEYFTIPFPDFLTIYYEINIWCQFRQHLNVVLEKIFDAYENKDSFVMPVDYEGVQPIGNGYYFVGYREGTIVSDENIENFSQEERIIKASYNFKVPAYLILDPKDRPLSYGRNFGNKESDGKHYVYKFQNAVDFQTKENVLVADDDE